jgi:hypothetical protein
MHNLKITKYNMYYLYYMRMIILYKQSSDKKIIIYLIEMNTSKNNFFKLIRNKNGYLKN